MNESGVWALLKKGMEGKWHATRIESSAGRGVPDVDFGLPGKQGKIELKYLAIWPKRPTTQVKLPLRPEQKQWIHLRGCVSGGVWVLIRIENDFFLLDWKRALSATEGWTQEQWYSRANKYWINKIKYDELLKELQNG